MSLTAVFVTVFASLYCSHLIKTLSEANHCCHLTLNRCSEQRRGGGDHCRPKVHLRGRRGAVLLLLLPELMLAEGAFRQVPRSETNGWRKGRGVTTSNISCQIHLNNSSVPAVSDTKCR